MPQLSQFLEGGAGGGAFAEGDEGGHGVGVAAVDLVGLGDVKVFHGGKVGQFESEVADELGFSGGCSHDLADGEVYFIVFIDVVADEGDKFESIEFLFFDVFCLEEIQVWF